MANSSLIVKAIKFSNVGSHQKSLKINTLRLIHFNVTALWFENLHHRSMWKRKEYGLNYGSLWIHCQITPRLPWKFLTSSRLVFLLRMLCGSGLWVRLLTSSSELRRCGLRIGLSGLALRRPAPPTPSSRLRCFLRMPWRRKAKLLGSTTDGENVTGWDGTSTEPKRNRKFYLKTNNYLMILKYLKTYVVCGFLMNFFLQISIFLMQMFRTTY